MIRRLGTRIALATVAALVLAGCTPDEPVETTPAPTSEAPSESPNPTGPEEALLQRAFADAREFTALVDEGFASGTLPSQQLLDFADAALVQQLESELDAFVGQGLQIQGASHLDTASISSLQGDPASAGTIVLQTCMDTSDVETTDADGEPVSGGVERQPRLFDVTFDPASTLITRTGPPTEPIELAGCGS